MSIALASILASVALTTGPASASTVDSTCVTANPLQVYDGGQITQFACNNDVTSYEDWTITYVASTLDGRPLYQVQNVGAMEYNGGAADCLDANAQEVYDGGAIIQWACDAGDPYQLWIITNSGGVVTFQNYGALIQQNAADCLDADAYATTDGSPIFQWGCNASDPYQKWEYFYGPNGHGTALENVGVLYANEGAY